MRILKTTLSVAILGLAIACGGDTTKEEKTQEKQLTSQEIIRQNAENQKQNETSIQTEIKSNDDSDVVEVSIEGSDQMKFNKDEIRVKAGQTVRLTLKHVGEMTVEQMGHNWVLLTQETDKMDFARKAVEAKANDYVPELSSNVIVHTALLGGGEEDTIEFEAPKKGTYTFICSFPGHVALMSGKFIVE